MATNWILPSGFTDDSSTWTSEALAYDENTGNYAYTSVPRNGWSGYLGLTVSATSCDRVMAWLNEGVANVSNFELDVYYSSGWHNIQSGEPTYGQYVEFLIGSTQSVTAMRMRFYSTKAGADGGQCYEAAFGEVVASSYYHGLKIEPVGELALCDVGTNPLRIRKDGTTYGIELVATDDPNASTLRINHGGVKAVRKYT